MDTPLFQIKEKEKKKAELAMLRDPKQERRLAMMDKLPDIVRIVKTYLSNIYVSVTIFELDIITVTSKPLLHFELCQPFFVHIFAINLGSIGVNYFPLFFLWCITGTPFTQNWCDILS